MKQEKIWDFYQNEGLYLEAFPEARQRYFADRLSHGLRILNIGVGAGGLERCALKKNIEVHSLDPSERAIARLREELNLGNRAQVGYAQAIPFESDYFDVVVVSEVLEHLDGAALASSLSEVLRVLRPGGYLLASTPYREDLKSNTVMCPDCGKIFHKVGHVQAFDKSRMRKILQSAGFFVESLWVTTFVDWHRPGFFSLIKSIVRWIMARLGQAIADPHLLVKAKKPVR